MQLGRLFFFSVKEPEVADEASRGRLVEGVCVGEML